MDSTSTHTEVSNHPEIPDSSISHEGWGGGVVVDRLTSRQAMALYIAREADIRRAAGETVPADIGIAISREPGLAQDRYQHFKVDPTTWVALMDRRGHSPVLVMHGFGPQRRGGPIMWGEHIDVQHDRPFDYSLDRGFWSMQGGPHADAIADYLFSVGRYHAFGCNPAHRPALHQRHSWWRRHGGKEPTRDEELTEACNATTTQWWKIPARVDEMAPAIVEGDDIAVDVRVTHFIPGQIMMLELNGKAVLRRIAAGREGPMLVADNPAYSPIETSSDEVKSCHVIGRVVAIGRNAPCVEAKVA